MAHLYPDTRSLLQILASSVVNMGETPRHIAIIMDGNRRFANGKGLETKFGHKAGLEKAKEFCRWEYESKHPTGDRAEITLYAFSIENFNRSQIQVDELMDLASDYCTQIVAGLQTASEYDCCIQFIGCWDLIPAHLKNSMAKIMMETRHCKTFKLNIAIAYTGRNGILRSMKSIEEGLTSGQLLPQDVTEYLVGEAQNLMPMAPVDMLIRTGGDSRISDFMMWEASHAYVHFMNTAWPEMSYWLMWDATIKYQMFRRNVPKQPNSRNALSVEQKERMDKFLENIREKKWEDLKKFARKSKTASSKNETFPETRFRQSLKKLLGFF